MSYRYRNRQSTQPWLRQNTCRYWAVWNIPPLCCWPKRGKEKAAQVPLDLTQLEIGVLLFPSILEKFSTPNATRIWKQRYLFPVAFTASLLKASPYLSISARQFRCWTSWQQPVISHTYAAPQWLVTVLSHLDTTRRSVRINDWSRCSSDSLVNSLRYLSLLVTITGNMKIPTHCDVLSS